jgi:hypothetical protein
MIARDKFIRKIKKFEKKYDKKLKDLLNENAPDLMREFLENPVIHGYLTRHADKVTFSQYHPLLTDTDKEEEYEKTDHYEIEIYKLLPNVIPYRNELIMTPKFYTDGTKNDCKEVVDQYLQKLSYGSDNIKIDSPMDIPDIIECTKRYSLEWYLPHIKNFIIFPSWTDILPLSPNGHFSTILGIYEPKSHRHLISLWMNTWPSKYKNVIESKFSIILTGEILLSKQATKFSNVKNYLNKLFCTDIDELLQSGTEAVVLKNDVEKIVCIVNYQNISFYDDCKIIEDKNIDIIYRITPEEDDIEMFYMDKSQKSVIDISLKLQEAKNDNNCVLYGIDFIQALIQMLKRTDIADKVCQLALDINQKSINSQQSEKDLVKIFRRGIKAYLPDYYHNESSEKKSAEDIRKYHLRFRWNLGNELFKQVYQLNNKKIITEWLKNHMLHFKQQIISQEENDTLICNENMTYTKPF